VVSGKLVQIAQGFLYDEQGHGHALDASPKLDMLLEMDQELGGDRAVIVYGLREEINVINKTLGKHNRIGRLGGGVSPKQAGKVIEDWRAGKLDRLLLHPASAGHGVDGLQDGGHHMIHFHPTWSAEMYDQVIKRLHRPGQMHDVFNWWIKADKSVDEIKYARVEGKLKDAEDFKALLRNIV
jgi:SNF2 family DNA or RNA helicase